MPAPTPSGGLSSLWHDSGASGRPRRRWSCDGRTSTGPTTDSRCDPRRQRSRARALASCRCSQRSGGSLEARFEQPGGPEVFVINQGRTNKVNWRSQLERIIAKAGLEPWEKLFQNLRSSRQTELCEQYPLHVVTAWLWQYCHRRVEALPSSHRSPLRRRCSGAAKSDAASVGQRWPGRVK